jgi:DMSO reductase anchor subunit
MHPAPSVILFTTLSGMGFGLLAFLGLGWPSPQGGLAFLHWALGYGLAVGGLLAATFHLGHPERAWRALSQWRSSWLSREGIAAIAALLTLALPALGAIFGGPALRGLGVLGAGLAIFTVLSTAMIYAQLRSVPRWNNWTVPAVFLTAMLAGGGLLAGQGLAAILGCLGLAFAMILHFQKGDTAFTDAGQTLGKATGLDRIGAVRVFEQPHTAPNYLMREMIFHVGRKHAARLRLIALGLGAILPALILFVVPAPYGFALATPLHLGGILAQRWLFFAEAEHVVGLYYDKA